MEGLAAIGAVVLVGVLGQGLWRARKAKPRQAEGAEDGRLEPSMARDDASLAPISDEDHGAVAPLPELRPVGPRKTARLDPLIDAIACLHLDTPISAELALAHLPPTRRLGTKPFLIEGLNAERGSWELTRGQPCRQNTVHFLDPVSVPHSCFLLKMGPQKRTLFF
jgi:hypothetical protein